MPSSPQLAVMSAKTQASNRLDLSVVRSASTIWDRLSEVAYEPRKREVSGELQGLFREAAVRWHFGDLILDVETRQLRRGDGVVHLSPKAFDLLALLISRRPSMVGKNELIKHLWSDTFVVDANLSNLVSEIRAALGDSERAAKLIRTVHRLGYAFDGDAEEDGPGIGDRDQGPGIRDQGSGIGMGSGIEG